MTDVASFQEGVEAAATAISDALLEEVTAMDALTSQEDASCIARGLRRERMRTMQYAAELAMLTSEHDWGF